MARLRAGLSPGPTPSAWRSCALKVRLQLRPNRWWVGGARGGQDARLARFRQVLLAAQQTPGYRESLQLAGLASPRSATRLRSIEDTLRKLPRLTHAEFRAAGTEFCNPAAPPASPQRLWSPISTRLRAAILAPNFLESDSVRVFDPDRTQDTRRFEPDLIAAPLNVLLRWAHAEGRVARALPRVHRAIIAFVGTEDGALPDGARDLLWRTFEVPVFEQRIGADGSVLAWECEAHDGLHLVEQNVVLEQGLNRELILTSLTDRCYPVLRLIAGVAGTIDAEPCGCGQPGLRLVGLSDAQVECSSSAMATGG